MDDQIKQLGQYVVAMKQQGIDEASIRQQLSVAGWSQEVINSCINSQTTQPPASVTPPHNRFKLLLGIIMIVLMIGIGTGVAWFVTKDDKTATDSRTDQVEPEEFATFTDPNFAINLPKSWSGDAGYKPGEELIFFYSPEDANDSLRPKAARMTIYVMKDSDFDRIGQQLDSLKKGGGTFEIINDETVQFGAHQGRYIEIIVASKEQPENKQRIASISVKGTQKQYFIDVVALEEHWRLHDANVSSMLRSFKPM